MAINLQQIVENINDNEEIQEVKETFSRIEQILNKMFHSPNASFPEEAIREFFSVYDLYLRILEENDLQKKCKILQELEQNLEIYKNKYKEFANQEAIDVIEQIQIWGRNTTVWLTSKIYFHLGYLEIEKNNNEKGLTLIYNGCLFLLDIVENYYNYFTKNGHKIIREIAKNLISDQPFIDDAKKQPGGEVASTTIAIRNAAKAILWEVDRHEKANLESASLAEEMEYEKRVQSLFPDKESYDYMRKQSQLFSEKWSEIVVNFCNKYILFENGEVLDSDEDRDALINRAWEKTGPRTIFTEFVSLTDPKTMDTPFNRISKK